MQSNNTLQLDKLLWKRMLTRNERHYERKTRVVVVSVSVGPDMMVHV